MDNKVKSITKIETGKYMLNEKVVLSDIDAKDDGTLSFVYAYTDETLDEDSVKELCTNFIIETLENALEHE